MSNEFDDAEDEPEVFCMHRGCKELASKTTKIWISNGVIVTLHYCPIHSWKWDQQQA